MPTLHWIGKDKVVNYHTEVPFRVLEHKYGYRGDIHLIPRKLIVAIRLFMGITLKL